MPRAIKRFFSIKILETVVLIVLSLCGNYAYASSYGDMTDKILSVSWMDHFVGHSEQQQQFSYPINEINIHINLIQNMPKTKIYSLRTYIPDLYHLFCLKEVLRQQKIRYYLENKNNYAKLIVYLRKNQTIKFLIQALKTYNIKIIVLSKQEEK